jgi:hypothetical protein
MDKLVAPVVGPMADHLTIEEKVQYGMVDADGVASLDDQDDAAREGWHEGYADALRDVCELLDGMDSKPVKPSKMAELIKAKV